MHVNIDLPSSGYRLTHIPEQVPIYTPGWREAIETKHFAQECKHDDPAWVRTSDPLIKGPTPNHFGPALSMFVPLMLQLHVTDHNSKHPLDLNYATEQCILY